MSPDERVLCTILTFKGTTHEVVVDVLGVLIEDKEAEMQAILARQ